MSVIINGDKGNGREIVDERIVADHKFPFCDLISALMAVTYSRSSLRHLSGSVFCSCVTGDDDIR